MNFKQVSRCGAHRKCAAGSFHSAWVGIALAAASFFVGEKQGLAFPTGAPTAQEASTVRLQLEAPFWRAVRETNVALMLVLASRLESLTNDPKESLQVHQRASIFLGLAHQFLVAEGVLPDFPAMVRAAEKAYALNPDTPAGKVLYWTAKAQVSLLKNDQKSFPAIIDTLHTLGAGGQMSEVLFLGSINDSKAWERAVKVIDECEEGPLCENTELTPGVRPTMWTMLGELYGRLGWHSRMNHALNTAKSVGLAQAWPSLPLVDAVRVSLPQKQFFWNLQAGNGRMSLPWPNFVSGKLCAACHTPR